MCLIFQNPSQLTLSLYSELTALNAIWSLTRARQNIQLTVMTCIAVKMPQMQETIRIKRSWAQNLHIWCTNKHRIRTIRKATALISQFPSLLFHWQHLWPVWTLIHYHTSQHTYQTMFFFSHNEFWSWCEQLNSQHYFFRLEFPFIACNLSKPQ